MTLSFNYKAQIHAFNNLGRILKTNYDEGRDRKPFSGGDWNEFRKGEADREQYENKTKGSDQKRPGGGINNDSRAGNFWGKLILFLAGLLLAIPSFFTAIVAGTILFLVFRNRPDFTSAHMRNIYAGTFWGMFAYLATAFIMSFIVTPNDYSSIAQSNFRVEKVFLYFFSIFETASGSMNALLKFHLPCLFIASLVINAKMGDQLGKTGYIKSIVVVALILIPTFLGLLYFMQAILPSQLRYFVTLV